MARLHTFQLEPRSTSLKSGLLVHLQLNVVWKQEDKEFNPVLVIGFQAMLLECDILKNEKM